MTAQDEPVISQMTFLIVFSLQFVLYTYFSIRAFSCFKEMRNVFNILQCVTLLGFLVDRIAGIVYDIYKPTDGMQDNQLQQIYMFFQLPQDLLCLTIMANFFSWVEVYLTFRNIIFLQKHTDQSEVLETNRANLLSVKSIKGLEMRASKIGSSSSFNGKSVALSGRFNSITSRKGLA